MCGVHLLTPGVRRGGSSGGCGGVDADGDNHWALDLNQRVMAMI